VVYVNPEEDLGKYGRERSGKDWVKAHAICGTKTNVVNDQGFPMTSPRFDGDRRVQAHRSHDLGGVREGAVRLRLLMAGPDFAHSTAMA
jgi:hypothetical protein